MIKFSEKTEIFVNCKEKLPVTLKSLKASLGHTINPALGHLRSNKDHCNFIIQNTYVIKTRSTISIFSKPVGKLTSPWQASGWKNYHWLLLLNLMTDLCHSKVRLNPSKKNHRASLNFVVSTQLIPWKNCSQSCFPTLGLSEVSAAGQCVNAECPQWDCSLCALLPLFLV